MAFIPSILYCAVHTGRHLRRSVILHQLYHSRSLFDSKVMEGRKEALAFLLVILNNLTNHYLSLNDTDLLNTHGQKRVWNISAGNELKSLDTSLSHWDKTFLNWEKKDPTKESMFSSIWLGLHFTTPALTLL